MLRALIDSFGCREYFIAISWRALEEEFGIALEMRDIAEMRNVGLIKAVLHRKGAAV